MGLLEKAVPLLVERSKTLSEMADGVKYFIQEEPAYDEKAREKFFVRENGIIFQNLLQSLSGEDDFSEARLETLLKETAERCGVKLGAVAQPLRLALTGRTASPGIFDVMVLLCKERTLKRVEAALKMMEQ